MFITEDDKKLQIAAKRIFTDDPTQLQRDFERAQELNNQHVVRPIRLLRESNQIYYLTMDKATSSLQDLLIKQIEKG